MELNGRAALLAQPLVLTASRGREGLGSRLWPLSLELTPLLFSRTEVPAIVCVTGRFLSSTFVGQNHLDPPAPGPCVAFRLRARLDSLSTLFSVPFVTHVLVVACMKSPDCARRRRTGKSEWELNQAQDSKVRNDEMTLRLRFC